MCFRCAYNCDVCSYDSTAIFTQAQPILLAFKTALDTYLRSTFPYSLAPPDLNPIFQFSSLTATKRDAWTMFYFVLALAQARGATMSQLAAKAMTLYPIASQINLQTISPSEMIQTALSFYNDVTSSALTQPEFIALIKSKVVLGVSCQHCAAAHGLDTNTGQCVNCPSGCV